MREGLILITFCSPTEHHWWSLGVVGYTSSVSLGWGLRGVSTDSSSWAIPVG